MVLDKATITIMRVSEVLGRVGVARSLGSGEVSCYSSTGLGQLVGVTQQVEMESEKETQHVPAVWDVGEQLDCGWEP